MKPKLTYTLCCCFFPTDSLQKGSNVSPIPIVFAIVGITPEWQLLLTGNL